MKRNKSNSARVRIDISNLFFERKPIIKNTSYYIRIYSPNQNKIKKKNPSAKFILPYNTMQPTLSPKHKSLSLEKVFHPSRNFKMKWPKITHPKWPFSKKEFETEEIQKKRIASARPSHKYHNLSMIRWLTQKYSDSVREKSIYSLLPNKIVPEYENESNKRHRKMIEYLESIRVPGGKEKFVNINPKYFYNNSTFRKILKLREMFLEIDRKGNHKMVLKEVVKLFKENKIEIDIKELKNLFYKHINKNKNKKGQPAKLTYLNFYQFMNFALSKDQDFILFMRKIKKNKKKEERKKSSQTLDFDEKKENIYIPLSFDIIIDYFINKEKQRNSVNRVQTAINEMDKIIQERLENEQKQIEEEENQNLVIDEKKHLKSIKKYIASKTLKDQNSKNLKSKKYRKSSTITDHQVNQIKKTSGKIIAYSTKKIPFKLNDIYEKKKVDKLKSINFAQLTKEFSNLFELKDINEENRFKNRIISADNSKSYQLNKLNTEGNAFSEVMKRRLRIDSVKEINVDNYEKFHDLRLALNATKEQFQKMRNKKLIEEDKKMFNMVDFRDIDKYYNNNKTYINNKIFGISKNFENSLTKRENQVHTIKTYTNIIKCEDNFRTKKKNFHNNRKLIYNYYCGKPIIMNYVKSNSLKKYKSMRRHDYVPIEFFSIRNDKD